MYVYNYYSEAALPVRPAMAQLTAAAISYPSVGLWDLMN